MHCSQSMHIGSFHSNRSCYRRSNGRNYFLSESKWRIKMHFLFQVSTDTTTSQSIHGKFYRTEVFVRDGRAAGCIAWNLIHKLFRRHDHIVTTGQFSCGNCRMRRVWRGLFQEENCRPMRKYSSPEVETWTLLRLSFCLLVSFALFSFELFLWAEQLLSLFRNVKWGSRLQDLIATWASLPWWELCFQKKVGSSSLYHSLQAVEHVLGSGFFWFPNRKATKYV